MDRKEKRSLRRRFLRTYISSVISISLVLFLVGLFALLAAGVSRVSAYFKENVKISVILNEKVGEAQAEQLALNIGAMPQVAAAELISQERGTEEMKEFLGEDFLDLFESNPIPASIDLQLREAYFHPDSITHLKGILLEDPMVEKVDYQEGIITTINKNLRLAGLAFIIFVALLAFISVVLINNTVRLNIYSRRFSIRTMQLVGATPGFIQRPFLYNALIQGAISALIAIVALAFTVHFIVRQFPQASALAGVETLCYVGAGVLVLGILICFICTFAVVKEMTQLSYNKLYY
ncbi:MAG: ABC transporter permease [Bacteroidales bacterium]|nr:ABC transporter permease [Bacteroidales bacterium]